MLIDSHCHLLSDDYSNLEEIINNMNNNIMIVSGFNHDSNKEVVELCNKYTNIYGTIGFHPDSANYFDEIGYKYIESNLCNPKIVGIGEIGLDYYYTKDNETLQKDIFIKQIELANKYNKPIVVHSRDAALDTFTILEHYNKGSMVDIHCFSYGIDMAKRFISIGCKLGIGGVITFKNSVKLQEVIKNIDIKNILLETDSPYLTPEPFRGKQNQPCNVILVAKKIAEIKKMSIEKVTQITTNNAITQFDLKL